MLMDNTLELLGITDSNIKITRFSAESVNGEKRNVIEARLTYNVDRYPYCESEKVVRNGSKILHTRLTELHQERFEVLYKQRYLCKECLKTWSARTDIVEEGHTLSHQLKRSVLHMAREGITATGIARICHCSPSSVIRIIDEAVELKSRVARLPENLCFDEFRSVNSTMSFICCDAEVSHDIVAILENRLTKTIRERLIDVLENYRRSGQNMDTAISTFKKNMIAVLNSVEYDFSNGPVEGINRRIKSLKRSCFGFRNLDNFRKRIALIRS